MIRKINSISFVIFIIISLIFSIPSSFALTNQQVAASVCGSTDIRNSLVLSVVTMCLPGILEKTQEWRQIECQAIVCNYEAVKFGLDPSFCTKQQEYLTCSYIVGEMFAIPPMSVLEHFKDMIAQALANPAGAIYGGIVKASRTAITTNCETPPAGTTGFLCNLGANVPLAVPLSIVIVTDALYIVQTLKEMLDGGFTSIFSSGQKDYCEEVADIKAEMEEILGLPISDSGDSGGFLGLF